MELLDITGAIITLTGSIFILLGAIGLIRMPDTYTRIQTGTKASTLGTILTLLGMGIIHLDWLGKLSLLILFVLITNPVSSQVLARAAHFVGIALTSRSSVDMLQEDENHPQIKEEENL